jgi:hypothetical protein
VMVYTSMCRVVHCQGTSGATAAFCPRLVNLDLSAGGHHHGHSHGDGGALPYFSREVVSQGQMGGHRHPCPGLGG